LVNDNGDIRKKFKFIIIERTILIASDELTGLKIYKTGSVVISSSRYLSEIIKKYQIKFTLKDTHTPF